MMWNLRSVGEVSLAPALVQDNGKSEGQGSEETSNLLEKMTDFEWSDLLHYGLAFAALIILSMFVLLLTRMVVMPVLRKLIKKTSFEWDDIFLDTDTFRWLSYIPPAIVFALTTQALHWKPLVDLVPLQPFRTPSQEVMNVIQGLSLAFITLCLMRAINASLTAVNTIYKKSEMSRSRPIKGFVQLAKIFVTIIGLVCAMALAVGREPWVFLTGIATFAAVLLFVFKDTILSLVASIQLTVGNGLRVGDWIEVPSCGADGDVIEVALHSVKVQNFDKTIITVPVQKMVNGAFKNWRGMQESGGRRIKRNICIDLATIHFLTPEEIQRLGEIDLIRDYVNDKQSAIDQTNVGNNANKTPLNARKLTNIGTFRAYIIAYLKSMPNVHAGLTFLVRQLQPTQVGLPIQIYIFTSTTSWVEYEGIQADIFDHLLAATSEFGLRVFQEPSGHDVGLAAGSATPRTQSLSPGEHSRPGE